MGEHEDRYQQLMEGFRSLHTVQPAAMDGLTRLHRAGTTDGALSRKHKELMALAIGITQHCEGCVSMHMRDAVKAGATEEEVADAIGVAILMGGGPASVFSTIAWEAYTEFSEATAG